MAKAAAAAAAAASSWSSASASAQRGATPNTASGAAPNNEDARSVLSIPVSEPPVYFDSDKYAQNVYTTVLWKLRRTYGFPVLYVVPFVALLLVFNTTRGDGGNLRYGIYGLAVAVVLITPLGLYVVYRSRVRRLQAALQMGLLADTPVDQVNAIVMYEAPLPNAPLYDANAIRYDEPLPLYNTRPPSIQERPREVAPRPSSPSLRERFANLVRIGSNTSMSTQQRQHLPRTRSGLSLSSASSSPQQQAGSVAGPHDVSPTPDPQNLNVAQRLLAPSLRVGRSRSNSVASSELVDEPGSLSLTELPRVGPSLRDTPDLIDVPMSSSLPVRPGPSLSNLREITGSVNPSASFSSSSSSSSMIGSQLAHEAEAGDIVLEVPSTAVTASPTVPRPRGRLWFRPANATPVLSNTSSDFPTANSMSLAPNRPREAPRARSDVLNDPTRNAVVVEVPTSNFIDKLIQRNRGPVVLSETKLTDRQYEAVARAERRAAQLNAAMIERAIQLRNRMREGQTAEGTSSAQAEGGTDISDAVVETTPAYGPSFSSSSSSSAAWASSSSPSSSISVTPIPPIQNDDLQLNLPSRPVVVAGTPTPSSSSLTTAVAPSQQPQQTDSPTSAGPASASSSGGASDVAVSTPTTLASNLTGPANTTSSANGKAPWDGSRELNGLRVAVEE
ncbi:hypothetical protein DFJ73DRAFT_30475 [Zopfochytrium polystomum]|nr:hypothetical protein DFJ73DRAFT_30475 [Zopfochytrium polystomum]